MARSKGFQGIVGLAVGVTWGTAVACGAGHGQEVREFTPVGNRVLIPDQQMTGVIAARASRKGNLNVAGSWKTDLRYEGNERIIAQILGTAGVPSTVDTTARKHALVLKNDIDGVFCTLAYEFVKDTTVAEITSAKLSRLTLRGQQGQSPELEVGIVGFDYTTTSSTNTTTTIDTITYPANREYAVFSQSVLRMNARTAGALGASDVVYVSGYEISIDRGLEGVVTTEFGDRISQPHTKGPVKISGSLTFADAQDGTGGNLAFIADQLAATEKKLDLNITSPTLAGASTQKFQHVLYLPCLQFGEGKPSITDWGALEWTIPFEAYHSAAVPTGFPAGYDEAITWEVYSQLASDPLV